MRKLCVPHVEEEAIQPAAQKNPDIKIDNTLYSVTVAVMSLISPTTLVNLPCLKSFTGALQLIQIRNSSGTLTYDSMKMQQKNINQERA